jgi:hypothetical protein
MLYEKSLKSSGPSSTPAPTSVISSTKIKREDYPQIKFFLHRDYTEFLKSRNKQAGILDPTLGKKKRGGTRLANENENVAMDYIEDVDGTIVDGETAKNIRFHARSVLIEMDRATTMKLPATWTKVGVTESKYFKQEMYSRFPYLNICHDDWKVSYLASRSLSSYQEYLKRQARSVAVKSEHDIKPIVSMDDILHLPSAPATLSSLNSSSPSPTVPAQLMIDPSLEKDLGNTMATTSESQVGSNVALTLAFDTTNIAPIPTVDAANIVVQLPSPSLSSKCPTPTPTQTIQKPAEGMEPVVGIDSETTASVTVSEPLTVENPLSGFLFSPTLVSV